MGTTGSRMSGVWAVSCMNLAVLKSPFKAEGLDLYSLFQKISKGDYAPPPDHYSSTRYGSSV